MNDERHFRFGVSVPVANASMWPELARKVEGLGYDVLLVTDHLTGQTADQLAPIPAMMAAAAATTTLRVGSLVLCNDFRHPILIAKEIATVDVLSGGRVELGLGAGWMPSDYEQTGIALDPPRMRIDRLGEAIEVIRGALGSGSFSFRGEYYSVADYEGFPKPVQEPRLPLLVGGGGKRVLRIAAQKADIIGISPRLQGGRVEPHRLIVPADDVDETIAFVRSAAGDMAQVELSLRAYHVDVTADRSAALTMAESKFGVPRSQIIESPFALVGSPNSIVEDLLRRRDRWGLSYVIIGPDHIDEFAPVVAAMSGVNSRV